MYDAMYRDPESGNLDKVKLAAEHAPPWRD